MPRLTVESLVFVTGLSPHYDRGISSFSAFALSHISLLKKKLYGYWSKNIFPVSETLQIILQMESNLKIVLPVLAMISVIRQNRDR